ncbi:hypothetical protein CCACVL1_17202 [Corchorus capsularis]|uniref:Uncharacterized protein n=1 Tax=Corchorus capsularis TaxID=210143 RepID=A0A1R3HT92_COCAP|nr:hypothetical protein CCACVL1_17202 [Corchorus capsularis]
MEDQVAASNENKEGSQMMTNEKDV